MDVAHNRMRVASGRMRAATLRNDLYKERNRVSSRRMLSARCRMHVAADGKDTFIHRVPIARLGYRVT
jgi:hypothetical protein